ncbi:MAG: 2-phospho-L-lactate guanylyltransferase [Hyphomicrobiaceae bacterium]
MSSFWIIVPVKDTRHSKQRLMASLDAHQRRSLALAMLEDVLSAIAPVCSLARCAVVTIDPDATAMAERYGMRVLTEGASEGHTGSVSATARLLGKEGVAGFLTLPGDIPNISTPEVEALLRAHRQAPAFTIAPSHDELGSNAVACSPVDAVPLRFGSDSYFPHLAAARRAGIEPTILRLPGIAMDLDTPEDLARFMRLEPRVPTRALAYLESLRGFGVAAAQGESA